MTTYNYVFFFLINKFQLKGLGNNYLVAKCCFNNLRHNFVYISQKCGIDTEVFKKSIDWFKTKSPTLKRWFLICYSKKMLVCRETSSCGWLLSTRLGSRINCNSTHRAGAQKTSLLAQFAAAMTASQCWPPDWDTKSYNRGKEGGGRKKEGYGSSGGVRE